MDWIDITILIIAAILAAPHIRNWWQRIADATIHIFVSPWNHRAAGGHVADIERIQRMELRRLHEMDVHLARAYEWMEKRERFLETVGPSFPPDHRRISSGPVHVKWDTNLDDFWNDDDPLPGPIQVDLGHSYVILNDSMEPNLYDLAKEQWERTIRMVNDDATLDWRKQPVSIGLCHRQVEGTVCAVHRWDALRRKADVEDQEQAGTLLGRLQCWLDPSLLNFNPNFIKERPEFDPRDAAGPIGDGAVCILELDRSVFVVGCPVSHSVVYANDFAFFHSHGENDWHLEDLDEDTSVSWVVQNMREFSLDTICNFGGCLSTERGSA
jgi:hypothetical protein